MRVRFITRQLLLIGISMFSLQSFAQNATIKGRVTGYGQPLSGASITVGNKGTAANNNGEYTIDVAAGTVVIQAGYVGYKTTAKTVNLNSGETVTVDFALESAVQLNEVVVLGSRSVPRTQLESPVPVDVFDLKKLAANGPQVNINQILNYAAPSFTSNTQSLGDGTDHVDPASLRGLGPDQVLVLVNGKRRYNSALVNLNGTFGKGSVGTDLNAIPVSAIDKIEILRDGAAAQYGSDAIAGVINIVLKKSVNNFNVSVTAGEYNTKSNGVHIVDGKAVQAALNYGLPIGNNGGYVNFSGSYDYREPTNRGGEYNGAIYTRYPGAVNQTDSFLAATGTTRKDYSLRVGQSQLRSGQFQYNLAVPINDKAEIYSFGGVGYRKGLAPGFYRYPNAANNVLDIYPLGYLPHIGSDIYDRSLAAGIRGEIKGWKVDFSNTFGQNQFIFGVQNSLNASLLKASPTSFNAGGPKFTQNTTNIDFSRNFDVLAGINIAFGSEYRFERYQLIAGDPNSYTNYGTATQVGVDANGNPILVPDASGSINTLFGPDGVSARPGGSQVFGGFRPNNAVNAARNAVAGYADAEFNFTKAFLANAAVRYENYSDFGSTTNGKLAFRYKIGSGISLRASGSTGFRAPSLQQRFYANTSTLFVSGVPYDVGTFPNDSRPAKLLGIPSLRPEKSKSVSAGITANLGKIKVTVDGYFTRINDRVVYTDLFQGSNAPNASEADKELYQILSQANASRAQFFANAINTETRGVDFVISYAQRLGAGTLTADLAGTFSKTQQVGDIKASELLKGKENIYFSNSNRIYLENAVPNQKANLSLNYTLKKFNVFLRNNYFGGVTEANNTIANQQFYNPRFVTDLSFGYNIVKGLKVTIGANNLLDIYPEKISITAINQSGQFIYSRSATQFGFNGRYLFGRLEFSL
jgi:iron complex outermembrane receptor protein